MHKGLRNQEFNQQHGLAISLVGRPAIPLERVARQLLLGGTRLCVRRSAVPR